MSQVTSRLGIVGRLGILVLLAIAGVFAMQLLSLSVFADMVMDVKRGQLREQTDIALAVTERYYGLAQTGELTEAEAQREALNVIEALRYGGGNYFWVNTSQHVILAHGADPGLRGQDVSGLVNPDGRFIYRDIVDSVRSSPVGVVEYRWPAPNAVDGLPVVDKLSVLRRFEPWGWILGTGSYLDDVQAAHASVRYDVNIMLGLLSLVLILSASLLAYSVIRPIRRLTVRMHHLSEGDTDAAVPYQDDRTVFGEISQALEVFRLGMIDRARMRDEQAARDAADLAREVQEEESRKINEAKALAAERRAEEDRRAAEEAVRFERETAEAEAIAEREARAAEQQHVVSILADGLSRFADGQLHVHIVETFPPEYEPVRMNFNQAVQRLTELIVAVSAAGTKVQASSAQISSASTEMALRTERASAALEETSAAMSEVSIASRNSAKAADDANHLMERTRREAEASRQVTKSAVGTMAQIDESSSAISRVVDLIESIAFQTNLLALNAGVEAARAGENGRGFAVVAMEVRALAQRSAEAVQEINALITRSRTQVESGVAEVAAAGVAIEGMITQILEISGRMQDIMIAAKEQSVSINGVESSVSEIDQMTQDNAAMFEDAAAVGIVLSEESARLTQLIERFDTSAVLSSTKPSTGTAKAA